MDGVPAPKIDTEGINDDIVVAVINQLEKTGKKSREGYVLCDIDV
jgi:hypothetical protein